MLVIQRSIDQSAFCLCGCGASLRVVYCGPGPNSRVKIGFEAPLATAIIRPESAWLIDDADETVPSAGDEVRINGQDCRVLTVYPDYGMLRASHPDGKQRVHRYHAKEVTV